VGELHVAAGTTCSRAGTTGGTSPNRARQSLTALGKGRERGKYSFGVVMTARARDLLVCLALGAKQFKPEVALRTTILIDGHFYSLPFSKALKKASGT
jgi:hypothetical protein